MTRSDLEDVALRLGARPEQGVGVTGARVGEEDVEAVRGRAEGDRDRTEDDREQPGAYVAKRTEPLHSMR